MYVSACQSNEQTNPKTKQTFLAGSLTYTGGLNISVPKFGRTRIDHKSCENFTMFLPPTITQPPPDTL